MLFLGSLALLLVARWWLYREPHHRTLVVNERKEGVRAKRKASSGRGNSEAKGHPNASFALRGIR